MPSLRRRIAAEFVGTTFLVAAIVGSGIMAETLSTDPGLRLLQNALATAGALTAVILALGPVSGAHLNPAVTLADRAFGGLTNRETVGYVTAQISGGVAGVIVANLMFDLPGIAPASAPGFVVAELIGVGIAVAFIGPISLPRRGRRPGHRPPRPMTRRSSEPCGL